MAGFDVESELCKSYFSVMPPSAICRLGKPVKIFGLWFDFQSSVDVCAACFSSVFVGGLFSPTISFNCWIELLILLGCFFLRTGIFKKLKFYISNCFSGVIYCILSIKPLLCLKLTFVKSVGLQTLVGSFSAYFKTRTLRAEYERSSFEAWVILSFL